MARKKTSKKQVSSAQLESLNAILRNDPALFERVSEIAELSQLPGGKIRKIDEVENELIEKINRLGQQTLSSFGHAVEEQAVEALRKEGESIHQREKKRYLTTALLVRYTPLSVYSEANSALTFAFYLSTLA